MNPKVSVVIPTYNRATKVGDAITSALGQTFSDLEVIVVDDGSSDDTAQVLQETFGNRIRYFAQTNQGASAARNKGLAEARGEWIALLDSDDRWEKEKLKRQFETLERFGPRCGVCYTDVRFMNHSETRTMFELGKESYQHSDEMGVNPEIQRLIVRPGGAGMIVCPSSLMARTDVVAKSGGFDTNLLFGEDSEFIFRLTLLTDFCYVNRPLVWFDRSPEDLRHVGTSAEWNKKEFVLRQTQIRFEKFRRLSENQPVEIQKLIVAGLGAIHSGLANCHLQAGEYEKAREEALKAVQTDFRFSLVVKWLLTWISPPLALRAVQRHQQRTQDSARFV
jgi:glycosyltransferase involved in cell wall biosynthesis